MCGVAGARAFPYFWHFAIENNFNFNICMSLTFPSILLRHQTATAAAAAPPVLTFQYDWKQQQKKSNRIFILKLIDKIGVFQSIGIGSNVVDWHHFFSQSIFN